MKISVIHYSSLIIGYLFLLAFNSPDTLAQKGPARLTSHSRGYMTTPQELVTIAEKAGKKTQPYKDAIDKILAFAEDPSYWPYGTISGQQSCVKTLEPSYVGNGAPLILAKAMAYHLTGNTKYAAAVRERILGLTDTSGYGGEKYSGENQCILNLSWYIPSWIMAADLIEDYSGWSSADKQNFQRWMAREIYKKVDWASDKRSNNWGSAGSATAAMIADYLEGSGILLVDRDGKQWTPAQAFAEAKQRQVDRMNGNSYMDNHNCHQAVGIRPDGGIPEELARGSTGCSGRWIKDLDKSWTYTMTYLQGIVTHAELLLRRGDDSLYRNVGGTGAGSLQRAILFLLHNPNDPAKSVPWKLNNDGPTLEVAYRFYRDPYMAQQLGIGTRNRAICGKSGQMLHFGTITHCFAPDENPGLPPTLPPPGTTGPLISHHKPRPQRDVHPSGKESTP